MPKFDFSGYATKAGVKCSDGRVITSEAFREMDGKTVPLVWQHIHNDPDNVLGHAVLEARDDGIYAYCYTNDTPRGKNSRDLVKHGDVNSLSIYANQLVQQGSSVMHGVIREVSLVLSGANPGALIDNLSFQHGDDIETSDSEAVIYTGLELEHADTTAAHTKENNMEPQASAAGGERTVKDIVDSMNDDQRNVMYYIVGQALEDAGVSHSDENDSDELSHDDMEGNAMRNVFEGDVKAPATQTLSHSDIQDIFTDANRMGSLKESVIAHAATYGIEDIDILFPDAKTITNTPEFLARRTEWVQSVLSGTNHSPFSRIKSVQADITADEARAKGFVKGNRKKDEVIKLLKRVTTPTTIYKKQKLDRDDIIDITDLDVVAWIKQEMRLMLDEEIARAILVGDGRSLTNADGSTNEDKINEDCIRPIFKEDPLYANHITLADPTKTLDVVDAIAAAMADYKGSGSPKLYMLPLAHTKMLLTRNPTDGSKYWRTDSELASDMRVTSIEDIPVFEGATREGSDGKKYQVWGIIVNLKDYTIGADKGGQISMFDDFDIDYNQNKYLIETRFSGCLTRLGSAIVIETVVA